MLMHICSRTIAKLNFAQYIPKLMWVTFGVGWEKIDPYAILHELM